MKKSHVPLLGLILLFGLSACGQEKGNEPVETVIVDTKTETPKEEKTPTPELKPTPNPTPTPEPKPTPVETKQSDVVYHSDFTTDDNMWYNDTKGDEHGVGGVENGRYWMASAASKGGYHTTLKYPQLSDITDKANFSVETKIKLMPGTADIEDGKVYGGLVWDYVVQEDNTANVYLFTIDKSGRYAIFSSKNSIHASSSSIVGLTQSDAIKTDADNVLRSEWKDGTISFFINGTKVHSMPYPYPKKVGLDVGALTGLGADYFTIKKLP